MTTYTVKAAFFHKLLQEILQMRSVIKLSGEKFREYEKLHMAKGTIEAMAKAGTNAGMAMLCEGVLENGMMASVIAEAGVSGTPPVDIERIMDPDYIATLMEGADIKNKTGTEHLKGERFTVARDNSNKVWCATCHAFTEVPHVHSEKSET